ncbi:Uncharacterised protein [Mycobacteroides abscessus subsp. abscessus]|nr:Uncharacterised protein [Mycobacteroides abscessus subsp. abscessus]
MSLPSSMIRRSVLMPSRCASVIVLPKVWIDRTAVQ